MLGQGEFDNRKHDIKHDKSGRTTVTDIVARKQYILNIPVPSPFRPMTDLLYSAIIRPFTSGDVTDAGSVKAFSSVNLDESTFLAVSFGLHPSRFGFK